MVSINKLVDIVEDIAGYKLERKYDLSAPKEMGDGTVTIPLSGNISAGNLPSH